MSLIDQQDAHADWLESESDRADSRKEHRRAELSGFFDDCLKQRNIDAEIGGGYYTDMIEVLNDACSDADQTIQRSLMQALIDCAAKGQIEAINSLHLVKDHFVKNVMNFEKSLAK